MTINEKRMKDHLWLDPLNDQFDQNYGKAIEKLVDGEPKSFYAPEMLNYFPWENFKMLFEVINKKLRRGGTILIGGIEPYILSKKLVSRELSLDKFNKIIFPTYQNTVSLPEAKKLLLSHNYDINDISIDYNTYNYTIEATK